MTTHIFRRPAAAGLALAVTGGIAVGTLAAPAYATGRPTTHPTSLTLKASKSTVAPKHKVSLTATLKSGHTPLANEQLCLESRTRAAGGGWSAWSACSPLSTLTDSNGQAVVNGVVPGNKKGVKTQYEVKFAGDTGYKASHSSVITVTTS